MTIEVDIQFGGAVPFAAVSLAVRYLILAVILGLVIGPVDSGCAQQRIADPLVDRTHLEPNSVAIDGSEVSYGDFGSEVGDIGSCESSEWSNDPITVGARPHSWLDHIRVGYDGGFIVASDRELNLQAGRLPFELKLNGWGQLRHTFLDSRTNNPDVNQFQLKRGRLIFSGHAFDPDIQYFVQLDGRSTDGDNVRLLDYRLSYDFGHQDLGLKSGVLGWRVGRFKMPFTMARWLSSREFEFTDRSVASTFFDVNRSLGFSLYGESADTAIPILWEVAVFNGLVTGGAETGSSGQLDDNFGYSGHLFAYPVGDWGTGELADFDWHDDLAVRIGGGFAMTEIDRAGDTEFRSLRVTDSGLRLGDLLPASVSQYDACLFSVHASTKFRGFSTTLEYYFRNVRNIEGADVPALFDHGFWFQIGKFLVPQKLQTFARWSRVVGDSGTLGIADQSADEVACGLARYFRQQHVKWVMDCTYINGAPINSATLDLAPGDQGILLRTQIQFGF